MGAGTGSTKRLALRDRSARADCGWLYRRSGRTLAVGTDTRAAHVKTPIPRFQHRYHGNCTREGSNIVAGWAYDAWGAVGRCDRAMRHDRGVGRRRGTASWLSLRTADREWLRHWNLRIRPEDEIDDASLTSAVCWDHQKARGGLSMGIRRERRQSRVTGIEVLARNDGQHYYGREVDDYTILPGSTRHCPTNNSLDDEPI